LYTSEKKHQAILIIATTKYTYKCTETASHKHA